MHALDTHPKRAFKIFKKHPFKSRRIWLKSCPDMMAQLALLDKPPQIWTLLNGGKLWNPSIWFNNVLYTYYRLFRYTDHRILRRWTSSQEKCIKWCFLTFDYHHVPPMHGESGEFQHPLDIPSVPWLAYSPRWYWLKATPPWTFPVKMSHGWQTMATAH